MKSSGTTFRQAVSAIRVAAVCLAAGCSSGARPADDAGSTIDAAVDDLASRASDAGADLATPSTDLASALDCTAGTGDCDGDPTNGCETMLATDAANCGRCGYSCGAGLACEQAACAMLGNADQEVAFHFLAPVVNATTLYFFTTSPENVGRLHAVDKQGGTGTVVATYTAPYSLGTGDDVTGRWSIEDTTRGKVYSNRRLANGSDGGFLVWPEAGGAVTVVEPDRDIAYAVSDGAALYWVQNDTSSTSSLWKYPLPAGPATMMEAGWYAAVHYPLALHAGTLYGLTGGSTKVKSMPTTGGASAPLFDAGGIGANGIFANDAGLFFTSEDNLGNNAVLKRVHLDGTGATTLTAPFPASAVLESGGSVYFIHEAMQSSPPADNLLARVAAGASSSSLLSGHVAVFSVALAVDADSVYFLLDPDGSLGGVLARMAR